ncbi:MAG: DHH family phosphoesterase [Treponema sp.]|jgi:nanoRNase/pAp phosphatase (c-di-AMP/oligoRNAs hydrolase)|nr:DHH family phosphoesterase [Treponema sp.]
MKKIEIDTIAEKGRIVSRIGSLIQQKDIFLLLGHKDPDTDCIASLVAFALLLAKFHKEATIYLSGPVAGHFSYLLAICKYNGIAVNYGKLNRVENFQAVVVLDTPKPVMIALNDDIAALMKNPKVAKIEIDHHLMTDSEYSGDKECSLVSEASSTCELIGYMLLKFSRKAEYRDIDFFTRNLALAILTGIVGDSQMGKYLKTRKERFFYRTFSEIFDRLLNAKTQKNSHNLSSMEAVFDTIQNLSVREKKCFDQIMAHKNTSMPVYYICLDEQSSAECFEACGAELVVNAAKGAADTLAEDSRKLGLVAYYDDPRLSDFVQFRLRRSADFVIPDLREVLTGLKIENGGGHPGAIGFRVKKAEIKDIGAYTKALVERICVLVGAAP